MISNSKSNMYLLSKLYGIDKESLFKYVYDSNYLANDYDRKLKKFRVDISRLSSNQGIARNPVILMKILRWLNISMESYINGKDTDSNQSITEGIYYDDIQEIKTNLRILANRKKSSIKNDNQKTYHILYRLNLSMVLVNHTIKNKLLMFGAGKNSNYVSLLIYQYTLLPNVFGSGINKTNISVLEKIIDDILLYSEVIKTPFFIDNNKKHYQIDRGDLDDMINKIDSSSFNIKSLYLICYYVLNSVLNFIEHYYIRELIILSDANKEKAEAIIPPVIKRMKDYQKDYKKRVKEKMFYDNTFFLDFFALLQEYSSYLLKYPFEEVLPNQNSLLYQIKRGIVDYSLIDKSDQKEGYKVFIYEGEESDIDNTNFIKREKVEIDSFFPADHNYRPNKYYYNLYNEFITAGKYRTLLAYHPVPLRLNIPTPFFQKLNDILLPVVQQKTSPITQPSNFPENPEKKRGINCGEEGISEEKKGN